MSQVLDFLTKWWPMLLAIGGFTTFANRISDKLIAPRWPRAGAVIAAISVDYWLVLREVASLFGLPTEAAQKAATIRAAKAAAKGGLVLLLLVGCTAKQVEQGIQTAVEVAQDVEKIAEVLCLLDQQKTQGASSEAARAFCAVSTNRSPYVPAARRMQANPRAFLVQS